jgi:hypothetical protein
LLVLIVLFLAKGTCLDVRRHLRQERFQRAFKQAEQSGEMLDLAIAAPFAWDTVHLVPSYTPCSTVDASLGVPLRSCGELGTDFVEHPTAIFVSENRVIEILDAPWSIDAGSLRRVQRGDPMFSFGPPKP